MAACTGFDRSGTPCGTELGWGCTAECDACQANAVDGMVRLCLVYPFVAVVVAAVLYGAWALLT